MLHLANVTLIAADCVYREKTQSVIRRCLRQVVFHSAFFLSHERISVPAREVTITLHGIDSSCPCTELQYIPIPYMGSLDDYSRFFLWDLPVYIPLFADFVLTVQHDGSIMDPSAWTDEFLQYDYIRAPWGDGVVGNGGFSLRSKRLLAALSTMRQELLHACPEDVALCRTYRTQLERRFGMVFAPREVANRFSVENGAYINSFGYHGRQTEVINGWTGNFLTGQDAPSMNKSRDVVTTGDPAVPDELERAFTKSRNTPSDINEHMDTLARLGRECEHITDFGARRGVSTLSFLMARPRKIVVYNRRREPGIDWVEQLAIRAGIDFTFRQEDVLCTSVEETDLLLLDTHHSYEQVRDELARHSSAVRRYIIVHDTTTFGEIGERPHSRGIAPAIRVFLSCRSDWMVAETYDNNNGLTVLMRTSSDTMRSSHLEPEASEATINI